jgi:oxygen-independent coproporphyrinogen-3 oxidase
VAQGEAPIAGEETVDARGRALERIMLRLRTRQGIAREGLPAEVVTELTDEGLVEVLGEHVVLTSSGRLLADAVVRRLAP